MPSYRHTWQNERKPANAYHGIFILLACLFSCYWQNYTGYVVYYALAVVTREFLLLSTFAALNSENEESVEKKILLRLIWASGTVEQGQNTNCRTFDGNFLAY